MVPDHRTGSCRSEHRRAIEGCFRQNKGPEIFDQSGPWMRKLSWALGVLFVPLGYTLMGLAVHLMRTYSLHFDAKRRGPPSSL